MRNSLYDALEVNSSSSTHAIQAALRTVVRRFWAVPRDASGDSEEAVRFAALAAAILVDPVRRKDYDAALNPGVGAGPVLVANGYTQTDQMGYPALVRGQEEGSFDIAARNDPFGAGIGISSRIGFTGDILMQAPSWPMLTRMMAPSESMLADNSEIAALLGAVDAAPAELGGLVRVRLLSDPVSIAAWDPLAGLQLDPPPDVQPANEPKSRLPFWTMGLLADLATPETETAIIALVFPTQSAADTAAATLSSAWQYQLTPASGHSFQEITGATATTSVSGTGPFVALLTATQPTTAEGGMIGNRTWSALLRAYYQRDLLLLAPEMP